jgi:hypothetical protein
MPPEEITCQAVPSNGVVKIALQLDTGERVHQEKVHSSRIDAGEQTPAVTVQRHSGITSIHPKKEV